MMRHDELDDHFRTADPLSLPSFCAMTAILKTRAHPNTATSCSVCRRHDPLRYPLPLLYRAMDAAHSLRDAGIRVTLVG